MNVVGHHMVQNFSVFVGPLAVSLRLSWRPPIATPGTLATRNVSVLVENLPVVNEPLPYETCQRHKIIVNGNGIDENMRLENGTKQMKERTVLVQNSEFLKAQQMCNKDSRWMKLMAQIKNNFTVTLLIRTLADPFLRFSQQHPKSQN